MRRAPRRTLVVLVVLVLAPPAALALPAGGDVRLQPRVIGGAPVSAGAYPFAARIEVDGLGSCTGTHLASRWVLTAGHCATEVLSGAAITDPGRFHVRVGNGRAASDPNGYLAVDLVLRHPAFNADRLLNDVTLLRLATPSSAPTIDLLPRARASLVQAGSSATIAGWGLISQTPDEVLAPTLYAGRIRLMSDAACVKEWGGDINRATMFCAGAVGTRTAETCSGDSGGPLLVTDPVDHRTYQAGSTSFGAEDCSASSSVFARLTSTSIRSFLLTTAGLGPATIGPPTVVAATDTTASVRATVIPGGADVWVSAQYGPRYEHSTRAVRVGGGATPVIIPITGLTAGRSRNVRVVAWSGYGVRRSAPVRVRTTDTVAPTVKALVAKGRRGQRIRLRFRPVDASLQVAALAEVMAGGKRIARSGSLRRLRNITAGTTYFFSFRVPRSPRATSWCIRLYDRAGHRSARQCSPLRLSVRPARTPAGRPFS